MRRSITPLSLMLVFAVAFGPVKAMTGEPVNGPTGFIPNRGQFMDQHGKANTAALYLYHGGGLNVQLRAGGFSYDAWRSDGSAVENDPAGSDFHIHRIDVELEGSDPAARWEASLAATDVLNYYTTGTGEAGITGIHHYERVTCRNIYPFIDLEFRTTDDARGVKYDFIVHRGGDPANIRMRYRGADADVDAAGSGISLVWADGALYDRVPLSYWQNGRKRDRVTVVPQRSEADLFTYRLEGIHAPWAEDRTLVIDPVPDLQWGTYYGGIDHHGAMNGVAIDGSGNVIAAGSAAIPGLATSGAYDVTLTGGEDALLVKFDASGQRLWATYYGGNNGDFGNGVAVDANGNIYLAGDAWSTDAIATLFAHQTSLAGETDAFLAKFTSQGTRVWGTYMGGAGIDRAEAITLDAAGYPAIVGGTASVTGIAMTGAADATYGGSDDAFIAKFSPAGVRQWSTYLGGSELDAAKGVSCDGTFFFISGYTASPSGIALGQTHDTSLGGPASSPMDAYLVKYSGLGQKLWGTYYGGAGADRGYGCFAELETGNAYLCGRTASTGSISTLGAHQFSLSGTEDGFLVKFNSAGLRQWGTYLGGTGTDGLVSVKVGSASRVFVAGMTDSSSGIATAGSAFPTLGGGDDVFADCFSSSGTRLWGTYYGGESSEDPMDLAVAGTTFAIVGNTISTTGIATPGAFQTSADVSVGNPSKFIARFTSPLFFAKALVDEHDPLDVRVEGGGFRVLLPNGGQTDEATFTLMVTDPMGRLVLQTRVAAGQDQVWIASSTLAPGGYLVILEGRDQRWVTRVMKD
jgi:hypothetical protein